jgi:hypothetical protein
MCSFKSYILGSRTTTFELYRQHLATWQIRADETAHHDGRGVGGKVDAKKQDVEAKIDAIQAIFERR